ncbi:MAG: MEMO1 family protein [archaeon]
MSCRKPAVAGQFYSSDKKQLENEIQAFLSKAEARKKEGIIGAVVPHAGYMYSGSVAAYSYKTLMLSVKPKNIVLLGPNHTGLGEPIAVDTHSEWETPLGTVRVNSELAEKISCMEFMLDAEAHEYEHSIEVQLPFLQTIFKDFEIIPICLGDQSKMIMKTLGEKLADTIGKKDIIIASTDFSHYVPYGVAYENDLKAVSDIIKLNVDSFYETIRKNNVSICGYGGVAALMVFAKKRGAEHAELLKYATSGDATNDRASVVGYSSLIVR